MLMTLIAVRDCVEKPQITTERDLDPAPGESGHFRLAEIGRVVAVSRRVDEALFFIVSHDEFATLQKAWR